MSVMFCINECLKDVHRMNAIHIHIAKETV